jgi:hypothetical protein
MAGQLLLVNPRRRARRKSSGRKRRRNPRRMSALQRKYFGPKRRRNPSRARRRSRTSSRRRRRNPVAMNPVRRHRRRSVARSHSRRRRRNPILGGGFIVSAAKCAVTGTLGALVSDMAWNLIPLPATVKTGAVGVLAKAAGTIALGMGASKMVGRKLAEDATAGALTVQLYSYLKPMLAGMGVPGLGYYGAGYALNEYLSDTPSSLNAFVPNSLNGPDVDSDIYESSNYPNRFVGEYIH